MKTKPSYPSAPSQNFARWRRNLAAERSKAVLYRRLSEGEADPRLAAALRHLSDLESVQADYWAGHLPAEQRPAEADLRFGDRVLLWLARRVGTRAVLPILARIALDGVEAYRTQPDAVPALATELEVAGETAALARPSPALADLGRDHRRHIAANGSLRAAVFGVNDGLVSNLSLIMGVAGVAPPQQYILLAGLAGLLAGAFSMAVGEFSSMLSQRELLERQLAVERQHIALAPAAERIMLARRYQEKGLPPAQAELVADHLMADPDKALDTIAREQLGLDPQELGSPTAAALASFFSFALGALVPLLPFLVMSGWGAVLVSAVLSAIALFVVGVGVSFFTGRHFLVSGARMLALGGAAASVTFLIGRLIGVSVAG